MAAFAYKNNLKINQGYVYDSTGVMNYNNIAVVGKFKLIINGTDIYYLKASAQFEAYDWDYENLTHGKNLSDKIFIRNILIPEFHVECSDLLFGKNNVLIPRLNKLLVNIRLDDIIPNIDRNNVGDKVKNLLSEAITLAIANAYHNDIDVFKNDYFIVDKLYNNLGQNNIFCS